MVPKDQPDKTVGKGKAAAGKPAAAAFSLWQEALFGVEILLLHASPVYYGFGIPRGDGAAVVIIPGFLGSDLYLVEIFAWLRRIGYRPYYSGIGLNADCPNLLIRHRLNQTISLARRETRRKVHLLGHSLGGLLARAAAAERPRDVASVITLGSPFRGAVVSPEIQRAVEAVRQRILLTHRARRSSPTVTRVAAPARSSDACGAISRGPSLKPLSTPGPTASSTGATASPATRPTTSK